MNSISYRGSLKTRLSILIAIAVMLVITALGIYFDSFLKISSLKNAHTRILHGYQRLAYNLKNIENSLIDGITFVQTDEQILASIELINNYQDKKNYNAYLLDEEKKSIADQLLNRVKLSFNDEMSLYDMNDELLAFVSRDNKTYQYGFVSYDKGKRVLYKKAESKRNYVSTESGLSDSITFKHVADYDPVSAKKASLITYKKTNNKIIITSHRSIIDKNTNLVIGHVELSRILDTDYFSQLSDTLNLEIKYSFNDNNERNIPFLHESIDTKKFNIQQSEQSYSALLKQTILGESLYYQANLDKTHINDVLTNSRRQLLLILILVTIPILLIMRYIINLTLDRPLSVLASQINKIEHHDYSESAPVSTGDELETVSVNINQLARTVQEREASLKRSMHEQKILSAKIRDSEAHLRTLIQTLPDLVWLKDTNGIYLSCNPKFERMFGAKETDIVGKTDYDFVDKELADFFRKHDKDAMTAGKPTINEEEVVYADDGHKELLETIKTPMLSPDGTLIGVLGVGRDITERRQTEEELRRSQKMDAIGQLTGGIAHDFNNLLGIMLGNLELLSLTTKPDEKSQDYIDSINKAGKRASDLTKQLLGFSRQEPSLVSTTDINDVIKNMKELIKRSLTPEVEIILQLESDLWLTEIDKGDLEDSLLNLCINARDAMSGRGHLTIRTQNIILDTSFCDQNASVKPGEYLELDVDDTGEGISKEIAEHIFEPFFTTKDQGKGTGLGLAMVYGFVTRSGGCITYNSEPDTGSSFKIYLPRSTKNTSNKKPDLVTIDTESTPAGQETILVVDDEAGLLTLAKSLLEMQGYKVLTASDGIEALKILQEKSNIDLLFSDIVMPHDLNGYELAEQACEIQPSIKVLLTSGYTENIELTSSQKHFAKNLLKKPYSKKDLYYAIRSALDASEIPNRA